MASSTVESDPISFNQLPLSPSILSVLDEIGYQHATPVQAGSIAPALDGHDLMVQSQTGTGKTAAFTLPLIESLQDASQISALVLTPTRELARQVATEAERLASKTPGFQVSCIYGGVSFDRQVDEIKNSPTLIVGTPGRVLDHLRRRTLSLKGLSCFVLDEADEMLSMGFADELDQILKFLPSERQTLLFSATFPGAVKRYAKKTLKEPISLSFLQEESSADHLEHYYILVRGVARSKHLARLIMQENPESALVFTNTRRDAELVVRTLKRMGIEAGRLSGDMDQPERDRVMKKIKSKTINLVVATDVAARGIDISRLSHVFHYQLPPQPEVYIHRSGRTGRAGAKGVVISLASSQDLGVIHLLRRAHHIQMIERPLPDAGVSKSAVPPPVSPDKATSTRATSPEVSTRARPREATPTPKAESVKLPRERERDTRTKRRAHKPRGEAAQEIQEVQEVQPTLESAPERSTDAPSPRRRKRREQRPVSGYKALRQLCTSSGEVDEAELRARVSELSQSDLERLALDLSEQPLNPRVILSLLSQLTPQATGDIKETTMKRSGSLSQSSKDSPRQSQSDTVQSDTVQSDTVQSDTVQSDTVQSDTVQSDTVQSDTVQSDTVQSDTVQSDTVSDPATWLYVNLGWRDCEGGFSAIRELIAELGGLLPEDIEQIKVKGRHSLILIDSMFSEDLIAAIQDAEYEDKTLRIEPARAQSSSERGALDSNRA